MTEFTIHDEHTAPDEARPVLAGIRKYLGFIPNLYGIMAESPEALNAYQALSQQFRRTSLPKGGQDVVWLTVSRLNGCHYCMAVHSTNALRSGLDSEAVAALRDGEPLADPQLEAIRRFTQAVVTEQGDVPEDEVQQFVSAGFAQRQILDVLVGVAMKTLSNYINHLAHTPLDDAFTAQAWEA
ncbi:carboxymuconolactone decarboxylase family protein [Kribbella sp. NPDC026596]|uniref:carboxymuconolactone decarboxylase family protein n=1 Tax=Kribbella sp. NPDC026596 TaxID=3155122 RepID=UPI0033C9FA8C